MSTKIYEAYRVKKGVNEEELLHDLYRIARRNVYSYIKEIVYVLMSKGDTFLDYWMKSTFHSELPTPTNGLDFLHHMRLEHPGEQYFPLATVYGFFDASLSVYRCGGRTYLVPYGINGHVPWGFLAHDERLEYFGYWDNVDPPEETPKKEWKKRRTAWEAVFDNGWFNRTQMIIWEPSLDYLFGIGYEEGEHEEYVAWKEEHGPEVLAKIAKLSAEDEPLDTII